MPAPKVQRESAKKKSHCALEGCRDGKDKKFSFALRASCPRLRFKWKAKKKMSLRVLWSSLGCKGKAFQHFFFCAARFVHAFRVCEKAATLLLSCFLCLRSSFTRNAFLFGASCCVRAIAPACASDCDFAFSTN